MTKVKLQGPIMWAKVFEENRDLEGWEGTAKETDGKYTINVTLDEEQMSILTDSGSMKRGSVTEEGLSVKFDRPHKAKLAWQQGKIDGPPKVTVEGKPWTYEDGIIPNGSIGEVTLDVYYIKSYKRYGTRFVSLNITKMAELEPNDCDTTTNDGETPF